VARKTAATRRTKPATAAAAPRARKPAAAVAAKTTKRRPARPVADTQAEAHVRLLVETAIYLQSESRRLAKEECAKVGITATQLNVLKLLQEIGSLSLSELSRHMAANNSTITGIIDRMVAADLVERTQSERDRRVWRIRLTARGLDIAGQVEVAPWDLLRGALQSLPPTELTTLVAILSKLAAHVERAVANAEGEST
jgi:DNA-binding MarR family transcriptional regulator